MKTPLQSSSKAVSNLVIALVLLFGLAIAQPFLWNFVLASAEKLHNKRTEEEQYTNLTIRLEEITKQNQAQQAEIEKLSVSFPGTGEIAKLIEHVETAAVRTGATAHIDTINQGEVATLNRKGDTGIIPLTITVRATGSATQLLEYIQAMEHLSELTTINSWVMEPQEGGIHALVMNVVFYLQPPL